MANLCPSSSTTSNNFNCIPPAFSQFHQQFSPTKLRSPEVKKTRASTTSGSPFGSIFGGCKTCGGKGSIECPGCKGTGKNKKNGNVFERWKCFDCQGFGLKSCPKCGKGGLTPEQRGER